MTETEHTILVHLKNYHRGAERAITYRVLSAELHINSRRLRFIVSEMIKAGTAPLCSTSSDGYFFPVNCEEIDHAQAEDLSRIKELAKKYRGRRRAWNEYKQEVKPKQLQLIGADND